MYYLDKDIISFIESEDMERLVTNYAKYQADAIRNFVGDKEVEESPWLNPYTIRDYVEGFVWNLLHIKYPDEFDENQEFYKKIFREKYYNKILETTLRYVLINTNRDIAAKKEIRLNASLLDDEEDGGWLDQL